MDEKFKYGMLGGDLKALLGECHRKGLELDTRPVIVYGCFSTLVYIY